MAVSGSEAVVVGGAVINTPLTVPWGPQRGQCLPHLIQDDGITGSHYLVPGGTASGPRQPSAASDAECGRVLWRCSYDEVAGDLRSSDPGH